MPQQWLLYPIFGMFILTLYVALRMLRLRIKSVREGKVSAKYFRYNTGKELPSDLLKTERHYTNLFELPIMFYVVIIMIYITQHGDYIYLVLSWLYLLSRIVHAYIHMGSNRILHRRNAFIVSWLILASLWVKLFFDLTMAR